MADTSDLDYLTVLAPTIITDAMLTSSTVAEPATGDPAAWSAATAYTVGQSVYRATTHRIYRNLIAGTDAGLPENTPLRWYDADSTLRWAMLDNKPGQPTVGASPLTVVLHPGATDSLWLGGLDATGATVTVKDAPGGTVTQTFTSILEASAPPDYYEHFFSPFKPELDYLLNSLTPYANMEVTVTLTNGSAPVTVSALAVGHSYTLGESTVGSSAKPRTFTTIKLDDNGNNITKPGTSAKDLTLVGWIPKIEDADEAVDVVTRLLTTNALWSASAQANYSALRSWGLGSAQIDYNEQVCADIRITVQGVLSP